MTAEYWKGGAWTSKSFHSSAASIRSARLGWCWCYKNCYAWKHGARDAEARAMSAKCLSVGLPWGQFHGWSSLASFDTTLCISDCLRCLPIMILLRHARMANIDRTLGNLASNALVGSNETMLVSSWISLTPNCTKKYKQGEKRKRKRKHIVLLVGWKWRRIWMESVTQDIFLITAFYRMCVNGLHQSRGIYNHPSTMIVQEFSVSS